ncbi:MAG: hypothetical protein JWN69_1148 [Alphaproteobacteria bacterium]|nr:hypothetical protein [Alphaproteobacteria bacterium]
MKFAVHAAALAAVALLPACGGDSSSKLREAAEQSDPAAANVLLDEANAIDERGSSGSLSDPNSPAQKALEQAGAVTASAAPPPPQEPPPPVGAKPHGSRDPVPPPKVDAAPPQGAPKS